MATKIKDFHYLSYLLKGGEATSKTHGKEFYEDIGHKGGQKSGGNFANDPERASEAGKKGGENSHGGNS